MADGDKTPEELKDEQTHDVMRYAYRKPDNKLYSLNDAGVLVETPNATPLDDKHQKMAEQTAATILIYNRVKALNPEQQGKIAQVFTDITAYATGKSFSLGTMSFGQVLDLLPKNIQDSYRAATKNLGDIGNVLSMPFAMVHDAIAGGQVIGDAVGGLFKRKDLTLDQAIAVGAAYGSSMQVAEESHPEISFGNIFSGEFLNYLIAAITWAWDNGSGLVSGLLSGVWPSAGDWVKDNMSSGSQSFTYHMQRQRDGDDNAEASQEIQEMSSIGGMSGEDASIVARGGVAENPGGAGTDIQRGSNVGDGSGSKPNEETAPPGTPETPATPEEAEKVKEETDWEKFAAEKGEQFYSWTAARIPSLSNPAAWPAIIPALMLARIGIIKPINMGSHIVFGGLQGVFRGYANGMMNEDAVPKAARKLTEKTMKSPAIAAEIKAARKDAEAQSRTRGKNKAIQILDGHHAAKEKTAQLREEAYTRHFDREMKKIKPADGASRIGRLGESRADGARHVADTINESGRWVNKQFRRTNLRKVIPILSRGGGFTKYSNYLDHARGSTETRVGRMAGRVGGLVGRFAAGIHNNVFVGSEQIGGQFKYGKADAAHHLASERLRHAVIETTKAAKARNRLGDVRDVNEADRTGMSKREITRDIRRVAKNTEYNTKRIDPAEERLKAAKASQAAAAAERYNTGQKLRVAKVDLPPGRGFAMVADIGHSLGDAAHRTKVAGGTLVARVMGAGTNAARTAPNTNPAVINPASLKANPATIPGALRNPQGEGRATPGEGRTTRSALMAGTAADSKAPVARGFAEYTPPGAATDASIARVNADVDAGRPVLIPGDLVNDGANGKAIQPAAAPRPDEMPETRAATVSDAPKSQNLAGGNRGRFLRADQHAGNSSLLAARPLSVDMHAQSARALEARRAQLAAITEGQPARTGEERSGQRATGDDATRPSERNGRPAESRTEAQRSSGDAEHGRASTATAEPVRTGAAVGEPRRAGVAGEASRGAAAQPAESHNSGSRAVAATPDGHVAGGGRNIRQTVIGHGIGIATMGANGIAAGQAFQQGRMRDGAAYATNVGVVGATELAVSKVGVRTIGRAIMPALEKIGPRAAAVGVRAVTGKIPLVGAVFGAVFTVWDTGTEVVHMAQGHGNIKKVTGAFASGAVGTVGGIVGFGLGEAGQEAMHQATSRWSWWGAENATRPSATHQLIDIGTEVYNAYENPDSQQPQPQAAAAQPIINLSADGKRMIEQQMRDSGMAQAIFHKDNVSADDILTYLKAHDRIGYLRQNIASHHGTITGDMIQRQLLATVNMTKEQYHRPQDVWNHQELAAAHDGMTRPGNSPKVAFRPNADVKFCPVQPKNGDHPENGLPTRFNDALAQCIARANA